MDQGHRDAAGQLQEGDTIETFPIVRLALATAITQSRGKESQAALAKRTGIGARTIQRMEAGEADPSLQNITTLGDALGFELEIVHQGEKRAS